MSLEKVKNPATLRSESRWMNTLGDEDEMLGTEGVRRTTGVPNISSKNFITDKNILFTFYHSSSTVFCNKNNFTGVLWEDDQYA
ncbi:MAG TPA: hypothetical protein ENL20_04495 [Candidatus Cloacimonetes bacterium]|nr:hypothetical protein [Candidatus Cloacimonadota bacterium]